MGDDDVFRWSWRRYDRLPLRPLRTGPTALARAGVAAATCATGRQAGDGAPADSGDPTELALLRLAESLGVPVRAVERDAARDVLYAFDPRVKRMSTVSGGRLHTKGAPEAVLPLCTRIVDSTGRVITLTEAVRAEVSAAVDRFAVGGLRVLAVALRVGDPHLLAVVAMTGDGVNDAPALRHADIGVAMGRSGTEVAREAATMVLTDDNFATIVRAVEAGRRVYDNVRKFVLYIFAHAVPEVVPFLIFALSGGAVPLPLTVLQILAIDLGTETLPALALGRERAEPGLMDRPPRSSKAGVIDRRLLLRAWGLLGVTSAVLVMAGFFWVLWRAGWQPGTKLPAADYAKATTMTFAGIVACQIGTAMASRTDYAALRTIGVLSNRLLLGGIAFELVFAASLIYLPPLQAVFGTAALTGAELAFLLPFPLIVWGVDEIYRTRSSRRRGTGPRLLRCCRCGRVARRFLDPDDVGRLAAW